MKKFLQVLSLLLALLMLLTAFGTLISCTTEPDTPPTEDPTPDEPDNPDNPDGPGNSGSTPPTPGANGKAQYTVSIKTIGGRPVSNLSFYIYKGDDLENFGKTDANGIGTVELVPANDYSIVLDASDLEGYNVAERYTFTGSSAAITLTSSVIMDQNLSGVSYKLGSIMHDFTVTTTDGDIFTLSEVLKEKKGVLINFWYSTCSPCISEFPFMQSAYEKYSEDIAVIGLNNYPSDTVDAIKTFKLTYGVDLPMAKDTLGIGKAFGINAFPTSIFVDRYGTVCLIEVGSLPSERPFVAAFEHLSATNYVQTLFTSMEQLTPIEKPNVEMPSSEEIGQFLNGNGFTATYFPETESNDAEYSWPFLTGVSADGKNCIYSSNSFKENSFATLHANVYLEAGQALAIDWFIDTEKGGDMLYILVNGKDIYRLSGTSTDWTTCYPYVATKSDTYKVSFIYLKDGDTDAETDRVLLSNFRIVQAEDVDTATYIPREAATNPNANGLGYQNYVTVVFNENDGYWHVGTADGPILLVNLMGSTQLSPETSLNDLGYDGTLTDKNGDIYEKLVTYANYAINGTLYGYSPVTAELRTLLERAAEIVGFERGNPNQWLQACSYYDAYGTTEQLEDPVKGIAFFAAFTAIEGTASEPYYNTVTYDGRVIMPRGLKYKFVPTRSGAYLIKSQSTDEVDGWLFNENCDLIYTASVVDRPIAGSNIADAANISMTYYMEAGKTYYIDIAYYDVYAAGTFTFTIEFIASQYKQLHLASPAYFTFIETTTGQIGETIAGGINVKLGDDGYYHELRADGTLGSIVYADFAHSTGLFNFSLQYMINKGSFNFALSSTDQDILNKLNELDGDKDACRAYFREYWGDEYAEWAELWKLEEVLAGQTHGTGTDLTPAISAYFEKMINDPATPELAGCVAVDEELAALLQQIMDKYTFAGVRNSWTKLCYYYKSLG